MNGIDAQPVKHITNAETFLEEDFLFHMTLGLLTVPSYPVHTHDFIELVLILGGHGVQVIDEMAYPITTGDVFVLQGKHRHGFRDLRGMELANIMFCPNRLPLPVEALQKLPGYHALFTLEPNYRRQHQFKSRLHLDAPGLAYAMRILRQLFEEHQQRSPGYRTMILATFTQLLVYLARCYSSTISPASRPLLQMAEVISLLESNYAEPLTLQGLAEKTHLSVNQFMRTFKAATGATPIDYLIRVRVKRATELLRDPQLSITDVALRVGFTDSNYFTRQFKRVMGMTPHALRRALNGLPPTGGPSRPTAPAA